MHSIFSNIIVMMTVIEKLKKLKKIHNKKTNSNIKTIINKS